MSDKLNTSEIMFYKRRPIVVSAALMEHFVVTISALTSASLQAATTLQIIVSPVVELDCFAELFRPLSWLTANPTRPEILCYPKS